MANYEITNNSAILTGNNRCFAAAAKSAVKTCDRYILTMANDRNGKPRWGIIAVHDNPRSAELKARGERVKADPRNRICCWITDQKTIKLLRVLCAFRLENYFPSWRCAYSPATGDWRITIKDSDRRRFTNDQLAAVREILA